MKTLTIAYESELADVARELLPLIQRQPIVCFHGEMGAGKTTLIKVICEQLGVQDAMSSPTFSIVNEYRDAEDAPIYHFDFYRVEKLQEALDIGADEYFYSGDVCLIEWPEMIKELIPESHLEINIKLVGANQREITILSHGG
ncbi:tRNA (adenosine(37)-N6)-threonylcarbamoyltransferase complex ATPase subunit type 1 TsaE [Marinoscillum furvescens]|uniref:tRNA threonylcarbamoyladenosine biosynthesis protein TsaE n=1 Tax=Marinoscillum furvescens DSM 4134 TaxID=1122208 RepID=A0A3D9L5E1_MARFU|nr:tRNA (adenosine(37)-N6)-threonylcarbamoyltransferase complex ATPase subunit type 1 TsaE [Marinoscillum furvescens]REE01243.1 tRNA threonylcarbamoyladenosine biosynthesis protein TsaE [Marinoscillum furvescens DSM 4134]